MFGPKSVVVWHSWDFTRHSNHIASQVFGPLRSAMSIKNQHNPFLANSTINEYLSCNAADSVFFSAIPREVSAALTELYFSFAGFAKLQALNYLLRTNSFLIGRLVFSGLKHRTKNVYTLGSGVKLVSSMLLVTVESLTTYVPVRTWASSSIRVPYLRKISTKRTRS